MADRTEEERRPKESIETIFGTFLVKEVVFRSFEASKSSAIVKLHDLLG